jgi:preprotein translocase subunit YajC
MIDLAYAMAQPPAGGAEGGSPIASFLPLILIFVVFYFLLIRPQKKQAQQMQQMINNLKKGDQIVTAGGMHGKVTALKGKQIEVEVAQNVRVLLNKSAVSKVITGQEETETEE